MKMLMVMAPLIQQLIPGYPGASQTVWTIANDVPTIVDASGVPTGE